MRFLLLSILGLISLTVISQVDMVLRFEHMVGDDPLELNVEYTEPNQGYDFSITRLQYYVAEIKITHDGGQVTPIPDKWLLVNAATQSDFDLGSYDINSVEGISYWIGVDPEHNHLDPTQYPEGHPLAPQNPQMHWGWAAGYRFACLEGNTGMNLILMYQIHALGDVNYHQVSLETGAFAEGEKMVIPVLADYMGMYRDINVSDGLIEHSETGAAATLLDNFSTNVYTAMYYTDIEEKKFEGTFSLGPNPAVNGKSKAVFSLPEGNQYNVSLFDLSGRMIKSMDFEKGKHSIDLEPGQNGIYVVQLTQNGVQVAVEKLVVNR